VTPTSLVGNSKRSKLRKWKSRSILQKESRRERHKTYCILALSNSGNNTGLKQLEAYTHTRSDGLQPNIYFSSSPGRCASDAIHSDTDIRMYLESGCVKIELS